MPCADVIDKARTLVDHAGLSNFTSTESLALPATIRSPRDLAPLIEHSKLKSETSPDDVRRLCEEAKRHGFYGVCVNPVFAKLAKEALDETPCKVVTVIGFPLGATHSRAKFEEVRTVLCADEFDMVIQIGLLRAGEYSAVFNDIRQVVEAADTRPVKAILETGLLTREQIAIGSLLAARAGARFLKTSTGFGPRGASVEDVQLMRSCAGDTVAIKAASGISDYETALRLVSAGATRIGTSKSLQVIR